MANRPILQNIMNATLSGVRAMPSKDSSADNSAGFASDRAQYYRSYDSTAVPLNKKWMGTRDASIVARRRRTNEVAIGSFNANGEIMSFLTKETLTTNRALQRVRSGGAIVPPKVSKKMGFYVPGAPTDLQIDSVDDGSVTLSFVIPTSDGNAAIIGYKYTLDGGNTYSSIFTENPFTINGLNNGQQYPIQIVAMNSIGYSLLSNSIIGIPSTVPDVPIITNIIAGNRSAAISFDQPSNNGGSPIFSYTITSNPTGGSSTYDVSGTTIYPLTVIVSGLTNGIAYTFDVVATNRIGSGIAATTTSVTPADVPGPPTIVSATGGDQSIILTFNAPTSNGGSSITNYAYSFNGTNYIDLNTTSSPVTITGLLANTNYTIYLKAKNSAGYGPASIMANATTISSGPSSPPAPTNLVAISRNSKITLTFTQSSDGGSAITNYEYSINGGETFIPFEPSYLSSPVTISGLNNGTTYAICLKAINNIGSSPSSDSINATPENIANKIRDSLSTSGNDYDNAADNTWIKITSAEYALLQTNVTSTTKVGTNDTIFNAAGYGNFNGSNAVFVANVPSATQPAIPANNFLYAFAVRFISKTSNEKMMVYVNNSTANSSSGFVQIGNYLPNVIGSNPNSFATGSNYYVLKEPSIAYTSNGLLGMFSGKDQVDGYPTGYFVSYVVSASTASGIKYKITNIEPTTSDILPMGMLASNGYGMGIQGLSTPTVQW